MTDINGWVFLTCLILISISAFIIGWFAGIGWYEKRLENKNNIKKGD